MSGFDNVKYVMEKILDQGAPGNSIAIYKGGKLVYENYEGVMNLDSGKAVDESSLFRIYSMTKVIAVTAALRFFERGEFLLTDSVADYLPEFAEIRVHDTDWQGNTFTREPNAPLLIKNLFSMTSGIASKGVGNATSSGYSKGIEAAAEKYGDDYSLKHLTEAIAATPLMFDPGSHWRYGSSLDVLARILEVISGKTFGEILYDEIFSPLGMYDTFFKIPDEKRDRLCSMYRVGEGGSRVNATDMDNNYRPGTKIEHASGGLISSLSDYSRFAAALACGQFKGVQILGKNTVDLMAKNQLGAVALADFEKAMGHYCGYGYGLGVRTMMDPAKGGASSSIGEFGWYGMAGSWMLVDPAKELSVVYMQQTLPAMQGFVQARLRNAIYANI